MLNTKVKIAKRVKDDLRPTEDSIDLALGQLGKMIHTVCTSRVEGDLPPHLGQEAIGHLTEATVKMGQVRNDLLAAHTCFAADCVTMLPEISFGDFPCPKQRGELAGQAGPQVRLVV